MFINRTGTLVIFDWLKKMIDEEIQCSFAGMIKLFPSISLTSDTLTLCFWYGTRTIFQIIISTEQLFCFMFSMYILLKKIPAERIYWLILLLKDIYFPKKSTNSEKICVYVNLDANSTELKMYETILSKPACLF